MLLITQRSSFPRLGNSFLSLLLPLLVLASRLQTKCSLPVHFVFAEMLVSPLRPSVARSHLLSPHPCHAPFWGQTQALKGLQLPAATMAYHVVQPQLSKQHLYKSATDVLSDIFGKEQRGRLGLSTGSLKLLCWSQSLSRTRAPEWESYVGWIGLGLHQVTAVSGGRMERASAGGVCPL